MLKEQINKFMIAAMKLKEADKVSSARLIMAKIKDAEIANRVKNIEVTDDDIFAILKQMIKQRLDSIEQYNKALRPELALKEQSEINIITLFLPAQFSNEKTTEVVINTIKTLGATSTKDMGKVVAAVKEQYGNNIDMAAVSLIVKQQLN